jgi:uncharacterized membrane protein YjjP (DUF1212 family)
MNAESTTAEPTKPETSSVLEFLYRLGQAYLACGEQTAQVELLLRRIAAAYGMRRTRIVSFPTALFISLHDGEAERSTLAEGPTNTLRLDQIADVYELGDDARTLKVTPEQGVERLSAILRKKPRFGALGNVGGNIILAIGLTLILDPNAPSIITAAVLGAIVGVLKILNRDRPVLAVPLPVVAAAIVSSLVYLASRYGLGIDPSHALVPPLVTFLPGGMLTLGMVELAYGDMVSGSSRLITGFINLVLIAVGLAVGAALVGVGHETMLDSRLVNVAPIHVLPAAIAESVPIWAPWLGVVVFGVGVYFHFSGPRNSLGWMMLVLLLTFAAQQLATGWFGHEVSGFFGMLVATPLGYWIQLRFNGPPSMVTFLPAFWLLVPGTLSLISVTQMLNDRAAGIDGLTSAVFGFAAIALGSLMGASVYKWLTEHFGWWQLQIGRVGSYFRRAKRK